ncbi:hypothetical protein EDC01DRAFT_627005 [Geopyxis carbonaria]|nr:hypothetical protein EDC01DRAFT_627005 [Geopyxis carbonaria]
MSSAPPHGLPSSKEKKYDRQLRLWGANGQNRLEASHIALFNASAAGCELLKNLVLPGIGQFTIIDDRIVEEADLGTNFFLDEESLGKGRAERAATLLGELNPDTEGHHLEDSLENLLETKPEMFDPASSPFTHIAVVAPVSTAVLLKLSPKIPTFLIYSIGFTACLRIASSTHLIVETHPDSLIDLRLTTPWPELSTLAAERTQNLDIQEKTEGDGGMNDHEHGHVPYVILMFKYLEDWKASHSGNYPSNYSEKTEFKALIQDKMRTDVPGASEENYEEAIAAVMKHLRNPEISTNTKKVLADPRCVDPTADAADFWIIAHAVKQFVARSDQGNGMLPLSGGFPDMKAESNTYVELQNIYRTRAHRDATLVHQNVQELLTKLGRDPESIPFDDVSLFTKHANFIRCIEYRSLASEFSADEAHKKTVVDALGNYDAEDSLIHDYVALRAWQEFYSKYSKPPGVDSDGDIVEIKEIAQTYLKSVGHDGSLEGRGEKVLQEIVRAGGGELHVISSLIGGIAAQEITKVITQQYVPANNTVVFDGVKSRTAVFEL